MSTDEAPTDTSRAPLEELVAARLADAATYLPGPPPHLTVGSAGGAYLTDETARTRMDFGSGSEVNVLGHKFAPLVDMARHHLTRYLHPAAYGEAAPVYAVEYAKALSARFPNSPQVLVVSSPTEAHQIAGRIAPDAHWLNPLSPSCELRDGSNVQNEVRQARDRGRPVVADETVTGFGRTGRLWAFEHYEVTPDVVVLGAAGGGGLPYAAVVAPKALFDRYDGPFPAMAAHPLVCAVAGVVLEHLWDAALQNVVTMGQRWREGIASLGSQFPGAVTTQGVGLLHRLVVSDAGRAEKMRWALLERGLVLGPGLRVTPPLLITESEIGQAVDIIASLLLEGFA